MRVCLLLYGSDSSFVIVLVDFPAHLFWRVSCQSFFLVGAVSAKKKEML